MAAQRRKEMEMQKRNSDITFVNKWDVFKAKRDEAIKKYVDTKRKLLLMEKIK